MLRALPSYICAYFPSCLHITTRGRKKGSFKHVVVCWFAETPAGTMTSAPEITTFGPRQVLEIPLLPEGQAAQQATKGFSPDSPPTFPYPIRRNPHVPTVKMEWKIIVPTRLLSRAVRRRCFPVEKNGLKKLGFQSTFLKRQIVDLKVLVVPPAQHTSSPSSACVHLVSSQ